MPKTTPKDKNDLKRIQVVLMGDEAKKFEVVRKSIADKFGEGVATDSNVVRAAIFHYADHVLRGEIE